MTTAQDFLDLSPEQLVQTERNGDVAHEIVETIAKAKDMDALDMLPVGQDVDLESIEKMFASGISTEIFFTVNGTNVRVTPKKVQARND